MACIPRSVACHSHHHTAHILWRHQVGPILGMAKRPYVDIIQGTDPVVPESILAQNLPPEAYDARIPMSREQVVKSNLGAYRKAAQQEHGLRTALIGGILVNVLYFIAYHLLYIFFKRSIERHKKRGN